MFVGRRVAKWGVSPGGFEPIEEEERHQGTAARVEGKKKGHNAPCSETRGRYGARGSVQSGDESVSIGLFLVPKICCYIFLALINVTGTQHPQVRKGLRMSFKPGGDVHPHGGRPPGLWGLGSDTNTGAECSALWPCPLRVYPFISWLQPVGVWPLAKGELRLLCFIFQKGKAEIGKKRERERKRHVGS